MLLAVLITATMLLQTSSEPKPLTDQQIADAIEMGRTGNVPMVQVGTILGVSKGDFNVFIEGPITRIAAAASRAFQQLRPFGANNVTNEMKAPVYRVIVQVDSRAVGRPGAVQHVVLQPRNARGLDGVVQPVKEQFSGASFDRLPDGEFDVVVATPSGTQRYNVSGKDRAKIEAGAGIVSTPPAVSRAAAIPSAPISARASASVLRLFVQGDGAHFADAIEGLQAELKASGISTNILPRGEPYDYTVIFGEGQRAAAAAVALDAQGNVTAVVVKGTFTEKGAAEGVGRDLAKKLAALAR